MSEVYNNNKSVIAGDQSKLVSHGAVDSTVENSFNTNNININYLEENEKVKEEKFIKSKRTYLEEKYEIYYKSICRGDNPPEGLIRGFGYIKGKHPNGLYNLLNVIDEHGKYIADHLHLDFKDSLFDYSSINTSDRKFVQFIGYPDKYEKNNSFDYCIEIIEPIEFMKDEIKNSEYKSFNTPKEEIERVFKKIMSLQCNNLYDIIDELQIKLNYMTTIYETNFIFDYIINLYMLNTATDDLYRTGIERNRLLNKSLRDIIMILGSTIYLLETNYSLRLEDILKSITYDCNAIQQITTYFTNNNPKFNNFCKTQLNVENNKVIKQLWDIVINRKRNFGNNANPDEITADHVVLKALHVLKEFI